MELFRIRSPERERAFKLLAAARDEARRCLDFDFGFGFKLPRGLGLDLSVHADLAFQDEGLRACPRIGKPALDQEEIQPFLHFLSFRKVTLRISSCVKLCVMPGLTSIVTEPANFLTRTPV